MQESITLETQTDGIYPNGQTYHNKSEKPIIEGNSLQTEQVIAALENEIKRFFPIYKRISKENLIDWLTKSRLLAEPQPLNIGDKDYPNRTLRWNLKYQHETDAAKVFNAWKESDLPLREFAEANSGWHEMSDDNYYIIKFPDGSCIVDTPCSENTYNSVEDYLKVLDEWGESE